MGLMDRLRGSRYAPTAVPVVPDAYAFLQTVATWQLGKPQWPDWDPERFTQTGYKRLALLFRCVNLIAHHIGTAPIRVFDEQRDGETVTPEHPLSLLMRRPNPQMGARAFWSHVGVRMATAGFCLIEKERDVFDVPIALWPLVSSWATAVPKKSGPPDWRYRVGGQSDNEGVLIKAEDVIVVTWADSPYGSAYGVGPLEACCREVGLSNAMTDFLKRFFDTGAVPLQAIIPDLWPGQTLTPRQTEELTKQFTERRAGLDNAATPLVLSGIKDIKRLGFDFQELAYTALRDLSELAIVQAFGIPASVAQIRVGLEHSDSRANAEVDEGKFYRGTIMPLWDRLDDRLTLGLLPEFDLRPQIQLEFDTSDITALQEGRAELATWLNPAVSGGWLSVHSWHRELGLPLPDGEDYYLRSIAISAVPASEAATPPELPQTTITPSPPPALPANTPQNARSTSETHVSHVVAPQSGLIIFATQSPADETYVARQKRAQVDKTMILRVSNNREPSVQRFLTAQRDRLITLVTDHLSWAKRIETYDLNGIDWSAEDALLRDVVQRIHLLAGRTALRSVEENHGLLVGVAWDLANPDVAGTLAALAHRVVAINETTRVAIAEIVTQGLIDGLRPEAIADNLRGLYDETYTGRSLAIARTESMVSYGEASAYGYAQSGVVDRAQIFDNPTHTDEYGASDGLTCASRDGIIVPLEQGMDHIYADHPNGSATMAPVLIGEN